jgi:hypothetical protein
MWSILEHGHPVSILNMKCGQILEHGHPVSISNMKCGQF